MRRGGSKIPVLSHLATIRKPATPADGETKPTWSDLATDVGCSRVFTGGSESAGSDKVIALGSEVVRMHYRDDIDSTMRIRFSTSAGLDNVLEIVSLGDPVGNRIWLEARCTLLEST